MEEIEIVITPEGKTQIKVVRSKGSCHDLTKPIEEALGKVVETKQIHNPGVSAGARIDQKR